MRKIKPLAAVVLGSALALAGCGGSDDDDEDVALTAITEANAPTVSAVVYRAASVLFDVASTSGTLPLGVVAQGASGGSFGLTSFAAHQLKAAMSRPMPAAVGAVGAVYEDTYPCSGGGTVTERIDDADGNLVESVGDSLKLTFSNCVEEGVTANGVVSFRLTVLNESSTGAKVAFDDLVVNDGTDVVGANGGFDLTLTEESGVSEVYELAGDALALTLNGDKHKLTSFTGSATTALGVGTVTYSFNGGVSDTSNNISVNAETVSAFVAQLSDDDYPGSGALRMTGAGNSRALLEVLSTTTVQISVDPEGDGSFTVPVEWTWSELEAVPG